MACRPGSNQWLDEFSDKLGNLADIINVNRRLVMSKETSLLLIEYRLKLHGLLVAWLTRIEEWEPGVRFVDMQLAGPYRLWHHTHEFAPDGAGGTLMRDTVRYALPLGPLGVLAHRLFVARDLAAIFDHRTRRVAELLTRR